MKMTLSRTRWLWFVAAAFLILLVTGFLTDLQRGADAPLLADAPGQTVVTQQVDDSDIR